MARRVKTPIERGREKGLTIIELMIAAAMAIIIVFGIGIVLSDSHRGWNAMYNRIYSDVVTDSHVARLMFDAVVRKASGQGFLLDASGGWVKVYYYSDLSVTTVDRYAKFYVTGNQLYVEHGRLLGPGVEETLSIDTVANNVVSCIFTGSGRSLQMFLTLDNGSQRLTTVTSAVMHN